MSETSADISNAYQHDKRAIALEVTFAVLAFWFPSFLASADSYLSSPAPVSYAGHALGPAYLISIRLGATVGVLLIAWKAGKGLARYGITKLRSTDIVWSLAVLAGLGVASGLTDGSIKVLSRYPGGHLNFTLGRGMSAAGIPFFLVAAVLYEEVFFRSYLCTKLTDLRWPKVWTITLTSFLFAMPHLYQGWAVLPADFVFGVVLGLAFLRLKTIWPVFLGHLAYDFIIVYALPWYRLVTKT